MKTPLITIVALTIASLAGAAASAAPFSEYFDAASPPALPNGWTSSLLWQTSTNTPDTTPNCARAQAQEMQNLGFRFLDQNLTSPPVPVSYPNAILSFRHKFKLSPESGATLEISIDGGGFTQITQAGGQFSEGAYSGNAASNPFGPFGWNGQESNYIRTTVRLPAAATGLVCQFRWRVADSTGTPSPDFWQIDTVALCDPGCPDNITVEAAPDACERVVEYAAPSCADACNPPSGSAFPVGTTTVTCVGDTAPSCRFDITVTESTAAGARKCSGCDGGMCGAGAAPLMPLSLLVLARNRRRRRHQLRISQSDRCQP